MSDKSLSGLEEFVYVIMCICTLGGLWVAKIVIKKAMVESR
jgi:hypothetical protein